MRLLVLFIAVTMPGLAAAQQWALFAQGGALLNSKIISSNTSANQKGSPVSGIYSAGIAYYSKACWEFGLQAGYRRYANVFEGDIFDFDPLTGTAVGPVSHYRAVSPMAAAAVAAFAKYHFVRGKLDYYAGVMPAYLNFGRESVTDTLIGHKSKYGSTGNGFALDAIAGLGYHISPGFGIYAEASGGAVNTQWFWERAWFYAASLSLGVSVRIAGKG